MENTIGIVVLNYNTFDETIKCIESIRDHTTINYRIYIVDNASKDGSGKKLFDRYQNDKDVVVLLNKKNAGYSAGNNIGVRAAINDSQEYIAIVNSDIELLNDAFAIMVNSLSDDSEIMMIGPSVVDNNGEESQILRKRLSYRTFVLDRHPFCDILGRKKEADRFYTFAEHGITKGEGSVSGCCFCMRARDFNEIGFFDENVFLYYEEDIIAYKASKRKKKAAVNTDAKVWHKANISTSKEGGAFVQFHRWTSALYLMKEYAKISKRRQIFVALWNILTWDVLSICSDGHRRMRKDFRCKNWTIVNRGS